MIFRRLMIADSNGMYVQLPGDSTNNPNNPVFLPYYTNPVVGRFTHLHVSEESTGSAFVQFWRGNTEVSGPVLLQVGKYMSVDADRIEIVGVRRAGEIWLTLSDEPMNTLVTRGDARTPTRGMQANIIPNTQISLYPGGPLSNVWCNNNSAPDRVSDAMVSGVSSLLVSGSTILYSGYTAANWNSVHIAAFNVDLSTQNVVNIRRLSANIPSTTTAVTILTGDINPWDRLGVIAIPSAANPNPALPPMTILSAIFEGLATYSRQIEFGYLSFGTKSPLP